MEDIELTMMNDIAQGMHNIDKRYQSGGKDSGLRSQHTQKIYKTLVDAKKSGGNVPAPTQSSFPAVPSEGNYAPVAITPEMLAEIEDYEKNNPDDVAPDLTDPRTAAQKPVHPMLAKHPEMVGMQPPVDKDQMEFNFDMVRADSVYKELTELRKDVTLLKAQNEKLLSQMTFLLEAAVEPQE